MPQAAPPMPPAVGIVAVTARFTRCVRNWIASAALLALAAVPAAAQTPAPPAPPGQTGAQPVNAPADDPREVEAAMIYRNLRIEQKIAHDQALAVLKRAGYPVDRIVEIH